MLLTERSNGIDRVEFFERGFEDVENRSMTINMPGDREKSRVWSIYGSSVCMGILRCDVIRSDAKGRWSLD